MMSGKNLWRNVSTNLSLYILLPILFILVGCSTQTILETSPASTTSVTPNPTITAKNIISTYTPDIIDSVGTLQTYLQTLPAKQTQCIPVTKTPADPFLLETPIPTSVSQDSQPTKQNTPTPTAGPALLLPEITPRWISTPDSMSPVPISESNYLQLANVAQWGKGSIHTVAYSPDGSAFFVGSSFGVATYSSKDPTKSPKWVPFVPEFDYDDMFSSRDGKYLLLVKYIHSYLGDKVVKQVRDISDGSTLEIPPDEIEWLYSSTLVAGNSDQMISTDGKLMLKIYATYEPNNFAIVTAHREIYNNQTNILISKLTDESTYVYYEDYHSPEGCDLSSFSYCGNVYEPSIMLPYRVGFSLTDTILAIMYRAPNLSNSNHFSTLRLYNVSDGSYITQIGSLSQPIESFAISPDGNNIVIGYVNGSIEVWDILNNREITTAWHFNSAIDYLAYSFDSRYILIQRMGILEVRLSSDGSLWGRYSSTGFAVSPVENVVAIADRSGNIIVTGLYSGKTIYTIQAHRGPIYALAFSPDGQILVSSGEDCSVRAWDVSTGASIHPFEQTYVNAYGEEFTSSRIFTYYMRFIPDTNLLIGFGSWGTVVGWNIYSGAREYIVESAPLEYYQGMVTLNPHFPEFFGVDTSNNIFYIDENGYDLQTGSYITNYQFPDTVPYGCSLTGPSTIDKKLRLTIGINNLEGRICVLNAKTYSFLGSIQVVGYEPNTDIFIDWLYLSPDGQQLIVTTRSGIIFVYQVLP